MSKKEIRQKIVLEGEKQYNQAVREATRNVKTLETALKAETAELGKNATAQQKAEVKAKSLRKQIAEQEKVVGTLREALEQAKREYGDNEDVVQKWEQKLNKARETLANMKNGLADVGQEMKQMGADANTAVTAAKSVADSIGKIADFGGAISSGLESIFTSMVDTVKGAISAVWEDMVDLAGRANAWVDLAGFWNTDAKSIQTWSHAVQGAHNSFDDLNNAVTRINMGDQKKIAEATGVSGANYEDKWKYAMAVMDAMAAMEYNERLNAAGEVFGEKRATKVLDLLNDWGKIKENLQKFENLGMTEDQIQEMSTLAEKIDLIKETWRAFLDSFEATHFGKLSLDLVGNAQVILEDLIKYISTGDDADLAKLEEDIAAFFDRIVQALQSAADKLREAGNKLQESGNPIVQGIGKVMEDLANALDWISKPENMEKVLTRLRMLADFWLIGKGAQLAGSIASLAANMKIVFGSGLLGSAAGAAGSAGTAAGLGSVLGKVGMLSVAVMMVAPTVAALLRGYEKDETEQKLDEVTENADKDVLGVDKGVREANKQGEITNQDMLRGLWNRATYTGGDTSGLSITGGKTQEEEKKETAEPVLQAISEEQRQATEAFWDFWKAWDGESSQGFDEAWKSFEAAFAGNDEAFRRMFDAVDKLYYKLETEGKDPGSLTDLPADWWQKITGRADENGITKADIAGFRTLPAAIQSASAAGVSQGVSGLQLTMDGYAVGRVVAPYVSQIIASQIMFARNG